MSIEELYKKRTKATLKGFLFLFLIPSPGLAIESFSQAKSYDAQIKKMVLEKEKEPIVVICPNQNKKA